MKKMNRKKVEIDLFHLAFMGCALLAIFLFFIQVR